MNRVFATTGPASYSYGPRDDFMPSLSAQLSSIITPGSTSTVTVGDAVFTRNSSTVAKTWNNVVLRNPLGSLRGAPIFTSDNQSVAAVDQSGIIAPGNTGIANITVELPHNGRRTVAVTVAQNSGFTVDVFQNFTGGTAGSYLTSAVAGLIAGKTAPTFTPSPVLINTTTVTASTSITDMFANSAITGPRNPSPYFGAMDLTAIPQPGAFQGAAISRRFMLIAAHYIGYTVGKMSTVYFTDAAGVNHGANVTSIALMPGSDVMLCQFDADLPNSITPMLLLPSNYATRMPSTTLPYPCLSTNQDRRLLVGGATFGSTTVSVLPLTTVTGAAAWNYGVRINDSGSPSFLPVNGRSVLLTCTTSSPLQGPNYAAFLSFLDTAIAVSSTPSATYGTADLSAFSAFS